MKKSLLIDKDLSWNNTHLELRLYMRPGHELQRVVVSPGCVELRVRSEGEDLSTHFELPVKVDDRRVKLTRNRGMHGETVDIKTRVARTATFPSYRSCSELVS